MPVLPSHLTRIELAEPFAEALRQAVDWLESTYSPIGIVVSGSIIRGEGHAASDLDLVVIHDAPWRQRVQRWFNSVPCEMFVNPPNQVRRSFQLDATAGRPVMAHMLATGVIVFDTGGVVADLVAEARVALEAGPVVPELALLNRQYGIATLFEDALDLRLSDPDRSRALVVQSLSEAAAWHFQHLGRWLPRSKALFADLDALDPTLGSLLRFAIRETDLTRQFEFATTFMEATVGHTGFFEWEGDEQPVSP